MLVSFVYNNGKHETHDVPEPLPYSYDIDEPNPLELYPMSYEKPPKLYLPIRHIFYLNVTYDGFYLYVERGYE